LSETRPGSESSTVGVVISHTFRRSHAGSGGVIHPSVRFQTADGRTVEFQNKIGTNAPPRVGAEVTVYYDPERPEDAQVAPGDTFKPNPKAFLVVGAIFLAVLAMMFLSALALVVWVTMS
jgi:Protein of unknown function (DUF3592)